MIATRHGIEILSCLVKESTGLVPEEAAVVDGAATLCSGGAVSDLFGGSVKTGDTVMNGEVVSALKKTENWVFSVGLLRCHEVLVLTIDELLSHVSKRFVDVVAEDGEVGQDEDGGWCTPLA